MPTPVTTARQCLTAEAAQALDEAVTVAHRRGHAQTTSLHAVSALLSIPSSALREACGRARNGSYSSRIQFKALELCLSVSLDRIPSAPQRVDEPPVSNSLMAAVKRSQANQRRQPDNFHFYQQQSSSSSITTVKVELRNLILSILDDPVVSRVFGEAGFRNCDIKLGILRPVHQLLRYSRYKGPPMFLCNLSDVSDLDRRGFNYPGYFNGDENCKRIGEVLVRKKGRNPLLVGVCAVDALRNFCELVQNRRGGCVLPLELSGLSVICIENEVVKFVTGNYGEGLLKLKFEEVGGVLDHYVGGGLVINFGDLQGLVGDNASVDAMSYVIRELANLLNLFGEKLWLIGAAASYETFMKILNKFPSIEKDWDLQLLPITSPRTPMAETYPRSSLMESFVPFGGFFSAPSDTMNSLSGSYQSVLRCHPCNERCEQEVTALSKGGYSASVADQYHSSLPSWLQMAELGTNQGLDVTKAKDDGMVLSAKVARLQKKWDNICQHLHYSQQLPKADSYQVGSQLPAVVGFQVVQGNKQNVADHSSNNTNESSIESGCKNLNSSTSMDLQHSPSKPSTPLAIISKSANVSFLSKLSEKPSKIEDDGRKSPTSATSVTTDLGLGISSASTSRELDTDRPAKSLSCSFPDFHGPFDQKDFKMLYTSLANRIGGRQEEAVTAICQTIVRSRTRNEKRHGASRADIWFHFIGPDILGKKKIAISLAEILFNSRGSFICVDLNFQDSMIQANAAFDHQEIKDYEIKFRGKTVVDYVAEELSKKPLSVVYLENIEKADLQAQKSLSQAVRTGRFSDSHGREVSISNTIFVTTSRFTEVNTTRSSLKKTDNYLEENVLRAEGRPIQMLIGFDLGDTVISHNLRVLDITRKGSSSSPTLMNKRKLIGSTETLEHGQILEMVKRAHKASNTYMDLNLPAEESEISEVDYGNFDSDSKAWLEDFIEQVDETVVFKPFDYDSQSENIKLEISGCFRRIVGSEGLLEIDSKVMDQIIAASCLLENNRVSHWVQQILSRAFVEAQKRYNLSTGSVVQLVSYEDEAQGALLPDRIIMN